MQAFDFGLEVSQHIDRYGSNFDLSRLVHANGVHVGCMRLGPGGLIGSHRTHTHQLFAVVEGTGWVRGTQSERVSIAAGQAVIWEAGEEHEAGTESGMVAIVVEGEVLACDAEDVGPIVVSGMDGAP